MSKKSRNQRHIRAMSAPVPLPSVPRAAHVHNHQAVRTNGNRIRRGCDECGGAWGKWRPMTEIEKTAYNPAKEETKVDGYQYDDYEQGHDNPYGTPKNPGAYVADAVSRDKPVPAGKSLKKEREQFVPTADEVSGLKDLLLKAQDLSISMATGSALNVADQAGVTVQEEKPNTEGGMQGWWRDAPGDPLSLPKHGDTPGFRRTGITDIDADNANRATWPVQPVSLNDLDFETLPDRDDHSDTAIVDDYDAEEQEYSDKRMCYVGIDGGELRMMSEEDAYQELDAARSYNADVPHVIGDAVWDSKEGDWTIPSDIMDDYTARYGFPDISEAHEEIYPKDEAFILDGDVDAPDTDDKVEAFVAESFGGGDDPAVETDDKPAWRITLDWGNDTSDVLAWDGWDYGAAHLIQHLNTKKRDDLEFAARKLGIRGVTTKVRKELLIRALVVMADTSLVKEHALNRAAVMLRTAPVKDSDTEWATHYAVSSENQEA